ncbi:MAG: DUF433 domain-containing protein [bacterium]|nr:DUF433 domain-containing protein [bacterium]
MLGFERITFDSDLMAGRACIRGMRVTVSLILNLVADGMSAVEIVEAYPYLEVDDVHEAVRYAAWLAEENVFPVPDTPAASGPSGGILVIGGPRSSSAGIDSDSALSGAGARGCGDPDARRSIPSCASSSAALRERPELGRTATPRRASAVGLRRRRSHHLPLPQASPGRRF